MKTAFKISVIAAFALAASGSLYADYPYPDYVIKRFDHPKAQPTFAYVPVEKANDYQDGQTIAFYGRGRSGVAPRTVVETTETEVIVPVERRRGRVVYVPVERW